MKYLVNRETKEHKVATPLAESIIKGYPDFKDDWQLVEADSEGWIPWSGGECPLPENALVCICVVGHRYRGSSPAANYNWGARAGIEYYRPILAEQEPDNHLSEEATRAINETFRRRTDEGKTAPCRAPNCREPADNGYCKEHSPVHSVRAMERKSVFDRLKSAVAASESIPGIIAEIDALLPDGYEIVRAGFACAGPSAPAEHVAEDMSDWRNWREGDILECIRPTEFHTKGRLYLIGTDSEGDYGILDDEGDVLDRYAPGGECFTRSYFRFHSRPAKESDDANN